jgi:signal peptidase I
MLINYNEPIIVSLLFLVVFFIFYLYKYNNKYIVSILSYLYKSESVKLKKDSKFEDWFFLIVLLILISALGLKFITFTVVISDSMKPEFQRGDMVLMQSVWKEPDIGDIITFTAKDSLYAITHRVISIEGYLVTKGDNNPNNDRYETTQDDVLMKAIVFNGHPIVVPKLGVLFITDYSKQGVIFKYGDQFTFMQQLSATIRAWGYIITIIAIISYIMSMKR